jgi:peroxiredoxin
MTISVSAKLPECQSLAVMGAKGPEKVSVSEIFGQGKVVLFAVPGAFTPGCSMTHLPGFVVHADAILAKGVSRIVCLSVNDAFVMHAWGEAQNAEKITMLADGNAEFVSALGLAMDASGFGMGKRSQRFAMIIENGELTWLAIEPPGGINETSAEAVLAQL